MNVLLIEPSYPTKFPPLGLLRISSYHKARGDKVFFLKLLRRLPDLPQEDFDLIYITTLYTYRAKDVFKAVRFSKALWPEATIKLGGVLASVLPDFLEAQTGIRPHVGPLDYAESYPPDYSLFPKGEISITRTSQGCPHGCFYCSTRILSPTFRTFENWKEDLSLDRRRLVLLDDNFLASPNFEKDAEFLVKLCRVFDFKIEITQGLDCRLFDMEKGLLLRLMNLEALRFAWDNPSQEGYIEKAILTARLCLFRNSTKIRVYVLYGTPKSYDTPEYLYHRLNVLNKLSVQSYPIVYRPLNWTTQKLYVAPNWRREWIKKIWNLLHYCYRRGFVAPSREMFLDIFGKNKHEFLMKLESK